MISKNRKKDLFHQKVSPKEVLTKNSFGCVPEEAYYYNLKTKFLISVNSLFNKTQGITLDDIINLRNRIIKELGEDLYLCLKKETREELFLKIKSQKLQKQFNNLLDNING